MSGTSERDPMLCRFFQIPVISRVGLLGLPSSSSAYHVLPSPPRRRPRPAHLVHHPPLSPPHLPPTPVTSPPPPRPAIPVLLHGQPARDARPGKHQPHRDLGGRVWEHLCLSRIYWGVQAHDHRPRRRCTYPGQRVSVSKTRFR